MVLCRDREFLEGITPEVLHHVKGTLMTEKEDAIGDAEE